MLVPLSHCIPVHEDMKEDAEEFFSRVVEWCESDTNLRTTTIGDSVFKKRPRPFHNMRPDVMIEAKLRA